MRFGKGEKGKGKDDMKGFDMKGFDMKGKGPPDFGKGFDKGKGDKGGKGDQGGAAAQGRLACRIGIGPRAVAPRRGALTRPRVDRGKIARGGSEASRRGRFAARFFVMVCRQADASMIRLLPLKVLCSQRKQNILRHLSQRKFQNY